jgi:hypothetical protein
MEQTKKSPLRSILKWLGIILLIIIIAAVALPFVFKDKIVAKVKDEANKSLNAKVDFGDYDVSIFRSFPNFKLTLNNLYIAGVDSFLNDTLIKTKKLEVDLDLMSVIKGEKYQVNKIYLDQPVIYAKVLKSGKANWDITKPAVAGAGETKETTNFKLGLKKFEIKDGIIIYDDALMAMRAALVNLNHTLSGDFTQDVFDMSTKTTIKELSVDYTGIKYLNKVNTVLNADFIVDMKNSKYTFKENEVSLNDLVLGVDGYVAMPKDDIEMDLKYTAKKAEFKNILSLIPGAYTKDFASVKTSGKLTLDGYTKGVYSEKTMPAFGAKVLIEDAMFQYPSLPKAAKDIFVDVTIDNKTGVPDNTVIDIKKFHVELGGNPVNAKMLIKTPVSDPDLNGEVMGKLNLGTMKDVIPIEKSDDLNGMITADVKMKGRMSAVEKGQYEKFDARGQVIVMDMKYKSKDMPSAFNISTMTMNFTPQYVEIANLDSKIGKSDFKANGKIENFLQYAFKDELLKGKFDLKSNLIDLNEFKSEPVSPTATEQPAAPADSGVVDIPANVNFILNANVNKLLYDNLTMTDVAGAVIIKDKKADLRELKMKMMGGMLVVNGSYNTQNITKPLVDFAVNISEFDIAETFKNFNTVQKLAPIAKYCIGKFSTNMSFSTELDKMMSPVLSTLSGKGNLLTKAVQVSNFEPINKLAEAVKVSKLKKLDLTNIALSFLFANGRVLVDPFDFKTAGIAGKIAGSNGFDQTIDYVVSMGIPRSELGGSVDALAAKAGKAGVDLGETINIEALLKGTVTKPEVSTNLKNMASNALASVKEQVVDKAKEELEKQKKEAEDKIRAEADKAKKEAEDKAKAAADKAKKEAEEKVKKEAENKLKNIFGKPK